MRQKNDFETEFDNVKMRIEYRASGFGSDLELEEVLVFIGEQEITPILSEKLLKIIDEECCEHYWKTAPDGPEYEPEDTL